MSNALCACALPPSSILRHGRCPPKREVTGTAWSWLMVPLFLSLSEVLTPSSFVLVEKDKSPCCALGLCGLQLWGDRFVPHTSQQD